MNRIIEHNSSALCIILIIHKFITVALFKSIKKESN
jgi:hypothetical protein